MIRGCTQPSPLCSVDAVLNNLPRQLTSFVGREREVVEVSRLLATTWLLTVTGAGGSGKTRLALEVAAATSSAYGDGIWLFELARLGDPALLPNAILGTLGIPEDATRGVERTVIEYLRPREVLLLLDNCEHLIAACAVLVERLLRACPRLRILATSREPLGVPGETAWRLPSLAVPDPSALPTPTEEGELVRHLLGFETIRLFVERASAADPSFELTSRNGPAIAQICHRLDGMPLAIELAAARARTLSPEQLAERLGGRFRLLTGGSRTLVARQQTLRATLDWSHDLLSAAERTLLRRLAVFPGSWTLDAAETVCAFDSVDENEVLDLLAGLVDKSLILVDDGTDPRVGRRYRLLETVREYAAERLADSGETVVARDRHRDWLLEHELGLDDWRDTAVSPTILAGLRGMHKDVGLDDIRAVLAWCQMRSDGPGGYEARLARLLVAHFSFWHWYVQGNYSEGLGALEGALAASATAEDGAVSSGAGLAALRALAMCSLAILALRIHDVTRAQIWSREAEGLARAAGDAWALAQSLGAGGEAAQAGGDFERARIMFAESLHVAEANNLGRVVAIAGFRLGRLACLLGDPRADDLLRQAVALARQADDPTVVVLSLVWLARAALECGDVERATRLADEGLDLARGQAFRRGIALGEEHAGLIALARGDRAAAVVHFAGALRVGRDIGEREGIAACLEGLAASANPARPDELVLATRVLGAAEAHRELIGNPRRSIHAATYQRAADLARQRLGHPTFETAFIEGRTLPIEQAVDAALRAADEASHRTGETPRPSVPLTPRERQVAALVASGLTNRQIAAELVMSERTVDGHVANILSKLDFATRAQIATWTVRQELDPSNAPS